MTNALHGEAPDYNRKPNSIYKVYKSVWYLAIVTLLWGSSFSLTGHFLAGQVDSYFAVFFRTLAGTLIFVPFMVWRNLSLRLIGGLWLAGALQFGVTYALSYQSYTMLTVPEMLLFTTQTPLYISLLNNALERRFNPWTLIAALFAVSGGIVIHYHPLTGHFWKGFWLLQLANLTFAAGQVLCRRLLLKYKPEVALPRLFGHFFLGALVITAPLYYFFGQQGHLPQNDVQWTVLIYLSVVATALGSYWLAKGSTLVSVATLSIFNELHVPVGLIINMLLWGNDVPLLRLIAGCALIAIAIAINYARPTKPRTDIIADA